MIPKVKSVWLFEKAWIEHIRPLFFCILGLMNKHFKTYEKTSYFSYIFLIKFGLFFILIHIFQNL
jgi:hypothetical protein